MTYTLVEKLPCVEVYCDIRVQGGLSARSIGSATIGLSNSLYGVSLLDVNGNTIGMGRVIGDGGCFAVIVDVVIIPAHQKKGLSHLIMTALMNYVDKYVSTDTDVTLLAVGGAKHLYEQYGFYLTQKDNSEAMRYNRKFIKQKLFK